MYLKQMDLLFQSKRWNLAFEENVFSSADPLQCRNEAKPSHFNAVVEKPRLFLEALVVAKFFFLFKCGFVSLSLWLIYLFSYQNKPLYTYNECSCGQMLLVSAPLFNRFSFLCISTRSRMGNNLKIVLLQIVTLRDFQPLQNRIVCGKTLSEKVSDLRLFHLLSFFSCLQVYDGNKLQQ